MTGGGQAKVMPSRHGFWDYRMGGGYVEAGRIKPTRPISGSSVIGFWAQGFWTRCVNGDLKNWGIGFWGKRIVYVEVGYWG